jgi:lauroyl/myristoyl acyltransferase
MHFLNIPLIYKLGTRWVGYLPASFAYAVADRIAALSYLLYKASVANVKQNLQLVFPSRSDEELSVLTRKLFRNYSKYLVDYGRYTNLTKDAVVGKIIHFDGEEYLEQAVEMKKGIILLTAHLGNWELGGIFFGSYGIKTNVVTIRDKNKEIDMARRMYRERHNVSTVTIGDSPFSTLEMVRALHNNEIVAMLIDRYQDQADGLKAPFFGKEISFPKGPFILSRITGAPVVVAFVVREGNGYRGIVERPLLVTSESGETEVLKAVVKVLEKNIIMYPDQWYNFTPI